MVRPFDELEKVSPPEFTKRREVHVRCLEEGASLLEDENSLGFFAEHLGEQDPFGDKGCEEESDEAPTKTAHPSTQKKDTHP